MTVAAQQTGATRRADPPSWLFSRETIAWVAFYVGHVGLGAAARQWSIVATSHALGVVALGLACALSGRLAWTTRACAYLIGSEVLWRMTGARVPYEVGKLALAAMTVLAVARGRRYRDPGIPRLPVAFFLLLLPSVVLLAWEDDLDFVRQQISFYLAGPFALAACLVYFHGQSVDRDEAVAVLKTMAAPLVSVLVVVVLGIAAVERLSFTDESNFQMSGGFGPNQVSALLGLGAVASFLIILASGPGLTVRLVYGTLAVAFLTQSILTFSRSGTYYAVGACAAAALRFLQDSRYRTRTLAFFGAGGILFALVIVPYLDRFTEGALSTRYRNIEGSGREELANTDLEIWQESPLLGVGPGKSLEIHARSYGAVSAHTEYTRLLAEHGAFGLVAMGILLVAAWGNVWRPRTTTGRAVATSLTVWSLLFLTGSAIRMATPCFLLGFASAFRDADVHAPPGRRPRGTEEFAPR